MVLTSVDIAVWLIYELHLSFDIRIILEGNPGQAPRNKQGKNMSSPSE